MGKQEQIPRQNDKITMLITGDLGERYRVSLSSSMRPGTGKAVARAGRKGVL